MWTLNISGILFSENNWFWDNPGTIGYWYAHVGKHTKTIVMPLFSIWSRPLKAREAQAAARETSPSKQGWCARMLAQSMHIFLVNLNRWYWPVEWLLVESERESEGACWVVYAACERILNWCAVGTWSHNVWSIEGCVSWLGLQTPVPLWIYLLEAMMHVRAKLLISRYPCTITTPKADGSEGFKLILISFDVKIRILNDFELFSIDLTGMNFGN